MINVLKKVIKIWMESYKSKDPENVYYKNRMIHLTHHLYMELISHTVFSIPEIKEILICLIKSTVNYKSKNLSTVI